MRGEGHIGLNMILSTPVFLLYPGSIYDLGLWIWFSLFIGMAVWPDIDLRFELKHRGYTHTLMGSIIFGIIGAIFMLFSQPNYILQGFLGGFTGTLGHMLGDLLTFMEFKPLWPLSDKEIALKLIHTRDRKTNKLFAKTGALLLTLAIVIKTLT